MTLQSAPPSRRVRRRHSPIWLVPLLGSAASSGACSNHGASDVTPDVPSEADTVEESSGLGPVDGDRRRLVTSEAWEIVGPKDDPFEAAYGAQAVPCGWGDLREESGGLEISTSACNIVSLQQLTRETIAAGAEIELHLWWQTLLSDEPTIGVMALALGSKVVWQHEVAIPGPADAIQPTLRLDEPLAAGTTVTFHLRNHGTNTWNLNRITWGEP